MFTLPDELQGYNRQLPVLFYFHVNTVETNNSRLHFAKPCISIGISGTKKIQTPRGIDEFGPGDLIVYTPGNYLSYQNFDTDQPFKSLMIFFDTTMLSTLMRQVGENGAVSDAVNAEKYYQSLRTDSYVNNFSASVMDLLSRESFTPSLQKTKLLELVLYLKSILGDFIGDTIQHPKQLSDYQLQKVIDDSCHGNLTLEEISFMCNMSLATFKRTFTRIYGTSPGKWIRDRKLVWADEQITKFHRLPKEVYNQAGYRDYTSFSYAFKQKFGVSPLQKQASQSS